MALRRRPLGGRGDFFFRRRALSDDRYIVIRGRRWRATDPAIPEDRAAQLRKCLMAWRRRAVGNPGSTHEQVQIVKEALGERGTPWWELTMDERRARWERELPWPADPDAKDDGE